MLLRIGIRAGFLAGNLGLRGGTDVFPVRNIGLGSIYFPPEILALRKHTPYDYDMGIVLRHYKTTGVIATP